MKELLNIDINNKYKISISKVLLFLLVFIIPTEPLFSYYLRLGVIILSTVYIIFLQRKIVMIPYILFEFIFLICLIVSLIYSPKSANGIGIILMLLKSYLHTNAIIMLSISLNKNNNYNIYEMMDYFVLGTIIISLYTMFVEKNYIFSSLGNWRLGIEVFKNNGTFMMLSYNILISTLWAGFKCLKNKKFWNIFSLVFLLFANILTGTKKNIFAIVIAVLIYIIANNRKKIEKIVIGVLAFIIVILLGYKIILNNEFLYDAIGYRIENYIQAEKGLDNGTQSTIERKVMREYGLELFKKSPIIGNGVSSFRWHYYLKSGRFLYSHCNYVELLCNQGMIGFVLYYGFIVIMLFKLIKRISDKNDSLSLFNTIFLLVLLIIDYGQVSYYRTQYILMLQLISLYLFKERCFK